MIHCLDMYEKSLHPPPKKKQKSNVTSELDVVAYCATRCHVILYQSAMWHDSILRDLFPANSFSGALQAGLGIYMMADKKHF